MPQRDGGFLGYEVFIAPDGENAIREVFKETVCRPWGNYENTYIGPGYRTKVITVYPGHRLSLQRHRWRDEHWFIVEGVASCLFQANLDDDASYYTPDLYAGQGYNIQKGQWHRVENKQQIPLVFVEVQTGNCFEEDIERREDDYGRCNAY